MLDKVFGQLEYKYNFFKYEKIDLFHRKYNVKIVVESYDKTILDIQRENYQNYSKYIESNKDQIIDIVKKYFLDIYGKNIDVQENIIPVTLYFSKDGSWGILFDTNFDEENGFSFFVQDNELNVGTQDMFI